MSLDSAVIDQRADLRQSFIAAHGHPAAELEEISPGASAKRFFRLSDGSGCVLMDAGSERSTVRRYRTIATYLIELGLSAPRVFAADDERELALLEDLGDRAMSSELDVQGNAEDLYAMAIDALAHLSLRSEQRAPSVPVFDAVQMRREVELLTEWLAPSVIPAADLERFSREFRSAWDAVLRAAPIPRSGLSLSDVGAENILVLTERTGIQRCGLLDFQDAVITSGAYDVASLLQSSRRDISPELEEHMISRYLSAVGSTDRRSFEMQYAVLGAQRHCRIGGTFARLALRDGKAGYLTHLPRVGRWLAVNLAHPALAPLRVLFQSTHFIEGMSEPAVARQLASVRT